MKLPRCSGLALLFSYCASVPVLLAQGDDSTPPQQMRMCIEPNACANLTRNQDHYDGRQDNETEVSSRYWITRWGKDHVEIQGATTKLADGRYPAEGTFSGRIAPGGGSLTDTLDRWRIGPTKSGTLSFTLTWESSPASTAPRGNGGSAAGAPSSSGAPTASVVPSPPSGSSSLFQDDGCTKSLPAENKDAFDAWMEGKNRQLGGLDQQTELASLMWYCKAAKTQPVTDKLSKGRAEFEICELYLEGFVLPSSHEEGVIRSQHIAPDPKTAFTWFLNAATDGNTNAMDRLAYLYMGGTQIKGNTQPKDFSKSVFFLKKAAARGDSWALLNIELVKMVDGFTATAEESTGLTEARAEVAARTAENPCLGADVMKWIRYETPERDVMTVQTQAGEAKPDVIPVVFYGDSYVCLAHLGPVRNSDLDHQQWGVFSGAPIGYWKYTVYTKPKGDHREVVARAALRQMVSEYADHFGEFVAASAIDQTPTMPSSTK